MFEVLDRVALAELSDEALISAVTTATQDEAAMASVWVAAVTAEMSASSLNPASATRSNTSNICAILLAAPTPVDEESRACG